MNKRIKKKVAKKEEKSPVERVMEILSKPNARVKFKELARRTGLTQQQLRDTIPEVRTLRPDLTYGKYDSTYWFSGSPTSYSDRYDMSWMPLEGQFGFITDTHVASNAERLDRLNAAYDDFAARGITTVLHTGDASDGMSSYRGHEFHVKAFGDQEQAKYFSENFPKRDGITTYLIAGNHDMDTFNKTQVDRLSLVVHGFRHEGKEIPPRDDIKYLGPYSAYLIFPQEVLVHMLHPKKAGGYAKSYYQQKRSEGMNRNTRPDLQLSGHVHDYCHVWLDGTHFISGPSGSQGETEYTKRLAYSNYNGYCIISYSIEDGAFARLAVETKFFVD